MHPSKKIFKLLISAASSKSCLFKLMICIHILDQLCRLHQLCLIINILKEALWFFFFFKLYATIKSVPNGYSLEIRNATVVLSLLSETSLQRLLKPQIITLIMSCNYVKLNNLKLYLHFFYIFR